MATDDDKDKQREGRTDEEAERDREERDEDQDDADERDEDAPAREPAEGDAEGDESATKEPRNRAERRQLAKQVKRGQATPDGEVKERDRNKAVVRPKVPPRTVTGKSTANVDEVPPWVKGVGDWLSERRTTVLAAAAVLVIGGAGLAYGLQKRSESRGVDAAKVVAAAEASLAPVRNADDPPDPPNMPPRRIQPYADYRARATAALAAADRATQGPADLGTTAIAKLQRGIALYDLGRYAEAKTTLEGVVGRDLAGLEGRALEVLAYCLESLNDLPGALRRFEELGRIEGDGWRDLASYHQARVLRRQNNNDRAKDLLRRLIERIEHARPEENTTNSARSIVEQAKALLHEIDPADPLGRRQPEGGGDTEELLRRLQRQFGGNVQIRRPGQGGAP